MSPTGTRVGPYALETPIGRAEGCAVWHAVRADGKAREPTRVAIRLLDDPGDPAAQARLEAEYQRLKAMGGTGAPQAWAHYAGLGALVFEPRRGATVRALIDAAQAATLDLDEATALEIALGVARILRHAHELPEPLVYGRVSPAEVLLGQDSSVLLTGWGGWGQHPWPEGLDLGQRGGNPPTPASDQYALGALLVTLLEPRLVQGQGIQAGAERIARRWPACGRLLETSLATDPADRYPQVRQVEHDLLSLTRQRGGVARIGDLVERCSTFRRGGAAARAMLSSLGAPIAPPAPIAVSSPPPVAATPPKTVPPPAVAPPPAALPPTDAPAPLPVAPAAASPGATPHAPASVTPAPAPAPGEPPTAAGPGADPAQPPEPQIPPATPVSAEAPAEEAPAEEDGSEAAMQLAERVALAVLGLLGMVLLAWLGRSCVGG